MYANEVKVSTTYPAMLLKHRQDDGVIHHNFCVFSIQNDPLREDKSIRTSKEKVSKTAHLQNEKSILF